MAFTADRALELLESAFERGRLGHAFLITGTKGSGKRELAARMITMVNGGNTQEAMDFFGETLPPQTPPLEELEGELVRIVQPRMKSRRIGVDAMRELEKSFRVSAPTGKFKVGVITDADRMNEQAENAFLKTLEEPPADCLLLMLTEYPERLLPTILSRCLILTLFSENEKEVVVAGSEPLLQALGKFGGSGFGNVQAALSLKSSFAKVLAQEKSLIAKGYETQQKEEIKKYKQATEGDWLKQREDFFKAQVESDYLQVRAGLLDVMESWLGDVVRVKCHSQSELDFPQHRKIYEDLSEDQSLEQLVVRMDALVKMKSVFETNAQEQLALEVGFMQVFG